MTKKIWGREGIIEKDVKEFKLKDVETSPDQDGESKEGILSRESPTKVNVQLSSRNTFLAKAKDQWESVKIRVS